MASLEAKGVEQIAMDEKTNRNWKATRSWWDGSAKIDGRSVIKGVDKNRWVTLRNRSAIKKRMQPLRKECSALAAEIAGVIILLEVVDLSGRAHLTVENIRSCKCDSVSKLKRASSDR